MTIICPNCQTMFDDLNRSHVCPHGPHGGANMTNIHDAQGKVPTDPYILMFNKAIVAASPIADIAKEIGLQVGEHCTIEGVAKLLVAYNKLKEDKVRGHKYRDKIEAELREAESEIARLQNRLGFLESTRPEGA